jgi:vacuolar-type H+-ATPase subunit F/Vma7
MSRAAVIGEDVFVQGFALAGALVLAAEDAAGARAAWRSLPPDVVVVVLTPVAADALRDVTGGEAGAPAPADGTPRRTGVLTVVMPS